MKTILATALLTSSTLAYGTMCKLKINVTENTIHIEEGRIDVKPLDIEAEVNRDTYDQIKVGDYLMIKNDTVKSKVLEKLGCNE